MYSFLTDDNNDLYLTLTDSGGKAVSGSELCVGSELESLRQIIVNKIRLQQGEYQYDLQRGIDYMGLILTDTPAVRIWESQVLDLIRAIPEITEIVYWNYGIEGNNFIFKLTVDTIYGRIEIKG